MIQYLFLNSRTMPFRNGTFSCLVSFAGTTRSFVPVKVIMNTITARMPNTANVFVHAERLSPKNCTSGRVRLVMSSVPVVARIIRKMLRTERSYWFCVISAFSVA